jgi:hypothetical protein
MVCLHSISSSILTLSEISWDYPRVMNDSGRFVYGTRHFSRNCLAKTVGSWRAILGLTFEFAYIVCKEDSKGANFRVVARLVGRENSKGDLEVKFCATSTEHKWNRTLAGLSTTPNRLRIQRSRLFKLQKIQGKKGLLANACERAAGLLLHMAVKGFTSYYSPA